MKNISRSIQFKKGDRVRHKRLNVRGIVLYYLNTTSPIVVIRTKHHKELWYDEDTLLKLYKRLREL